MRKIKFDVGEGWQRARQSVVGRLESGLFTWQSRVSAACCIERLYQIKA